MQKLKIRAAYQNSLKNCILASFFVSEFLPCRCYQKATYFNFIDGFLTLQNKIKYQYSFTRQCLIRNKKIFQKPLKFKLTIIIYKQIMIESLPSLMFCEGKNEVQLFCCSPNCNRSALVCMRNDCPCLSKNHQRCTFVHSKGLVQKIKSKIKSIPQPMQTIFAKIETLYDQLIQVLSRDRQALLNWKENYGLNQLEFHFVRKINENSQSLEWNNINITGNYVSLVIQNFQKNTLYDWFQAQYAWFEQGWKTKNSQLIQSLKKLSKWFFGFTMDECLLPDHFFQNKLVKNSEKKIIKLAKKNDWVDVNECIKKGNQIAKLKELRLYHKGITKIEGLHYFRDVRILRLDGNFIKKIENLQGLCVLQKLSLNSNQIEKIENLDCLSCLTVLALQNNQIQIIQNLLHIKMLQTLYIGANPATENQQKRLALKDNQQLKELTLRKIKFFLCVD